MADSIRVLHVEDDPEFATVTAQFLERESDRIDVDAVTTPDAAIDRLQSGGVDCIVSDYDMPGMDGVELLEAVRDVAPSVPFILFTGKGSEEVASEALAKGATDYLQKGTGTDQYALLANRIENATVQHQSTSELKRQTDILETAQEMANLGVCEMDAQTGEVWLSEGMFSVFDVDRPADGGSVLTDGTVESVLTVYHPDDRDAMRTAIERAAETGASSDLEVRLETDRERWVSVRCQATDGDGESNRVRITIQDISDHKDREQALRRTERRFQAIFDDPEMLFGVLDPAGRVLEVNETALAYVDADREAVRGVPLPETPWWHETADADIQELVDRASEGEYVTEQVEIRGPDGDTRIINGSIRPVTDDDGGVSSLVVSARDVTERYSSRAERDFFESLIEETTDIITVIGTDGSVQYANSALERLLGYDPLDATGDIVAEYVHPDDRDRLVDWFTNDVADPAADPGPHQFRIEHGEGGWRWLEAVARDHLTSAVEGYVVTARDVTERKKREQELEYYETVIEGLGESTFVTNADVEYVHVNTTGADVTGYSEDELLGQPVNLTHSDEEFERIAEAVIDLATDDERDVLTLESTVQTKDGDEVPVEITMTVRYDEDGEFAGTVGVVTDISERKETERELREHESIIRAIPDEIAVMDTDGYLQRVVPPAGAEQTEAGYDPAELEGQHIGMVMPDEALEESLELFTDLAESDRNRGTLEHKLVTRDGEPLLREAHLALLRDDDGSVEGSVSILRDIEERKERERELMEYESIVKAIPDEVVLMDTDGIITRAIPPVDKDRTNSGHTPEELEGMHVTEVMTDESVEAGAELIAEMVETDRERATFEMEVATRDGGRRLREDHLALVEDEEGKTVGTVGVLRDIEERKAYERELERQNERLERFAEIASHDLRNPLNLAQGYMEMVEQACDTEHTETVADALNRMEQLIEDTLTWARQGSTVEEREPVALASLAPECWEAVGSDAADIAVTDDVTIHGDPNRIRQVIENLLRNAVEHGGADVTVEIGAIEPEGGNPRGFYVADDGPGIPPEDRGSVFDAGFTTAADGTGFGLAIIGEICDAHGWEINVAESEAGGARFEITGVYGSG